ncbi:adenosylcobinamide amidohydrolase [Mesorhizobium soli]|uniref:adenosylcobinamide amidohydrolase n=1 Tax=Pseudaminobacter soli (ex Li et al. 2025) TaxID=1295366 RepID=UPI0024761FC3|nr:adenosylcobinamide amidohydrolase [Mesorhizobium soli]MDH6229570.1 adenosylcobinamide amidohydrolase [Mesorhizobium soli]
MPSALVDVTSLVMAAFSISCMGSFLVAEFASRQTMLSWSLTRPGFVSTRKVAWLQVRNADLSLDVDPIALLEMKMGEAGHEDAVQLMTSRAVRKHHLAAASFGEANASCLATVGLGNAGRVGESPAASMPAGTINLLAHVDRPLTTAALIEAMSIATEARTAAIIDLDWRLDGRPVTGTGTDCIVVAAPDGEKPEQFAGLHTDIGAAIGRAVYDAVRQGGEVWVAEQAGSESGMEGEALLAVSAD